jgi:hypothetical protein
MTKQPEELAVLASPDGTREWTPEDATQATNLRAQGWAPKSAAKPTTPTPDK